MKKRLSVALLVGSVLACAVANGAKAQLFGGGSIVYDPIHHATTVLNHAEQLAQTATQIAMLRDMIENSIRAGSPSWGELEAILDQMDAVLRSGQALTYALEGIDSQFAGAYPGYDPADDYASLYQGWSRQLLDTLRATLAAAGVNARDARATDEVLAELRRRNARAPGRMQALQIANSLASRELEELAKLRQLVASSISAQNVYFATQESREAARVASFDRFLGDPGMEIPTENRRDVPGLHLPFGGPATARSGAR